MFLEQPWEQLHAPSPTGSVVSPALITLLHVDTVKKEARVASYFSAVYHLILPYTIDVVARGGLKTAHRCLRVLKTIHEAITRRGTKLSFV